MRDDKRILECDRHAYVATASTDFEGESSWLHLDVFELGLSNAEVQRLSDEQQATVGRVEMRALDFPIEPTLARKRHVAGLAGNGNLVEPRAFST